MQIEGLPPPNPLPASNTAGQAASGSGNSSQASGQPVATKQQPGLSEESIVSMLKQDGVLVNFSIDKNTHDFVVKVINPFTNAVIREIPPQEIPLLVSNIQQAGGMLVDQQV
jgi:flagellar protein FlaG